MVCFNIILYSGDIWIIYVLRERETERERERERESDRETDREGKRGKMSS